MGWRLTTLARRRPVTVTVLAATTVLVVVLAVTATGYPVNHVSANDGGVWLVNDTAGTGFAEMNVPIEQLGVHFGAPKSSGAGALDILQSGTTVIAVDEHAQAAYPVDEDAGAVDANNGVALPVGATSGVDQIGGGHIALGGATVAVFAPGSGSKPARVWASSVGSGSEPSLAGVQPSVDPLAKLAGGEALAVDDQGDVFLASPSELLEYPVAPNGFRAPIKTEFPQTFGSVELTTVGSDAVVFDPTKRAVYIPSTGTTVPLSVGGPFALQQSGPDASSVVVATMTDLLAVPMGGGNPVSIASVPGSSGSPAQPVALDGCDYAAWAGSPGYDVQVCPSSSSSRAAVALKYAGQVNGALRQPVLRVNNNFVVLNDAYDGGAWLVAGSPDQVINNDDWLKVFAGDKPSKSNNAQGQAASSQAEKPKLVNPTVYARAGQESVLHLLDDDTDPNNSPLAITQVMPTAGPEYSLAISPDTETVVLTLEPGAAGSVQFSYGVVDGKGQTATGPVTVDVTNRESPPAPIKPQPLLHVVSGGTVSFGMLGNWRDPESDPVSLAQAQASAGQVSWTSDGTITYTAPTTEVDVPVTLAYEVTDGRSAPVGQNQRIVVVGSGDTVGFAPTGEADVARVVVGQAATISPLSNDLFGADPTDPGAKLALSGPVSSVTGLTVTTNTVSGQITVIASQADTYLLSYQDSFGSAPLSQPTTILVDAVPPPTVASPPPVTEPVSVLVHGTNPLTVDVLTSDFDPAGGLLTVTSLAEPVPNGLVAAVEDGQYIRVGASAPPATAGAPITQILSYQVSDGHQSAAGQVSVTEEPALAPTPPVVPVTYATVRAGNEIDVPVLATASDPDGASISLLSGGSQAQAVGLSPTDPTSTGYRTGLGTASVEGAYVRYEAPPGSGMTAPETVTASFIVEAADGSRTTGQSIVTVLPDNTADTQPQPVEVDARVAAGGTVNIPIPTTGVDPDGQDVTVTGITSTPALGRITAVNATGLVYEAYPVSSTSGAFAGGTDMFSYGVTSPSGQTAQADVRVGVTPPAAVQAPVAIDHTVTGSPGKPVSVSLLTGDIIAPGDQVTVEPLGQTNHPVPGGAWLVGNGVLEVTAPNGAAPLDVAYAITDGTGAPSVGHVIVRSQPHYASAPVAADYFPKLPSPTAKSLTVNVLARDNDPDASRGDLVVIDPPIRHSVIKGADVVLPVGAAPAAIPYTIESRSTGQKSVGVVHVPGNAIDLQQTSGTIHVPEGASTTANLDSYIHDPGHDIRITTTGAVRTSPAFGLTEQVTGNATVRLTGTPGYQGPGSLVVQVADAASLSTPGVHIETLAIPVVVGSPTAIVRCPTDPIELVQGGRSVSASISSLCQIWMPPGSNLDSESFTESWARQASAVSLSSTRSGRSISLLASSSATPGTQGQITVGVPNGGAEASAVLNVTVVAAPLPTVNPVTVPGVETGHSVTVDMTQYVQSPLAQPRITVQKVVASSPGQAQVSSQGSTVTITPTTGSHGAETFAVTVTDQNASRDVTGNITLQVLDRPSAPTGLQGVPANQQVTLSWDPSQPNGATVTRYQIAMQGGGTRDAAGTTYTWSGLQNAQSYTFTVQAFNQVGASDLSPAAMFQPKSVPDAPENVTASGGNQQASVQWPKPFDNGQPILGYTIAISPSAGGVSTQTVAADQTTFDWTGLSNNEGPYSFTVIARNAVGSGPVSAPSRPVYAHFTPTTPGAPTATGSVSPDQTTTTITVTWPEMTPCNDAQPCKNYVVTELKNGSAVDTLPTTGGCGGSSSQCSASFGPITNDGSAYSYELEVVNEEGDTSTQSPASGIIHADGVPGQITDLSATAKNSSAQVKFTLPASHGAGISSVEYQAASSSATLSGTWPNPGQSGQSVTETISGMTPVVSYTITVVATNEIGEPGPTSNPAPVTPYGNPDPPSVNASANGNSINYSWSGGGNDGLSVASYTYCIDGSCNTVSGPSSTTGSYSCGQTHTLTAYVTDTAGQNSSTAAASASTAPCPQPNVTVAWGGRAPSSICQGDTSCTYLTISWSNFSSGSHTVTPLFDGGYWGYPSHTVSGSSGSFGNFYAAGFCRASHTVTATVDGVGSSNSINTESHGC